MAQVSRVLAAGEFGRVIGLMTANGCSTGTVTAGVSPPAELEHERRSPVVVVRCIGCCAGAGSGSAAVRHPDAGLTRANWLSGGGITARALGLNTEAGESPCLMVKGNISKRAVEIDVVRRFSYEAACGTAQCLSRSAKAKGRPRQGSCVRETGVEKKRRKNERTSGRGGTRKRRLGKSV